MAAGSTLVSGAMSGSLFPNDRDHCSKRRLALDHRTMHLPMALNCKHVVAALLQAVSDNSSLDLGQEKPEHPADLFTLAPSSPAVALSPAIGGWINTIAQLERSDGEDYPPDVRQRMIYVLDFESRPRARRSSSFIRHRCGSSRTTVSPEKPAATSLHRSISKRSQYIRPSDRAILALLSRTPYPLYIDGTPLSVRRAILRSRQ